MKAQRDDQIMTCFQAIYWGRMQAQRHQASICRHLPSESISRILRNGWHEFSRQPHRYRETDCSPGLRWALWHPTSLSWKLKGLKHRNKFELEVNSFWRDLSSALNILSPSTGLSWLWIPSMCRNLAQINTSLLCQKILLFETSKLLP